MTDDTIMSHAEALAEIKRLQRANLDLAALLREQGCRLLELEAEFALVRGTLAKPTPPDDQPDIVHNVPPNAPPHNE